MFGLGKVAMATSATKQASQGQNFLIFEHLLQIFLFLP
jgi:hypothetical protein